MTLGPLFEIFYLLVLAVAALTSMAFVIYSLMKRRYVLAGGLLLLPLMIGAHLYSILHEKTPEEKATLAQKSGFAARRPLARDVAGTYVLDDESIGKLKQAGLPADKCAITFNEDGTFTVTDLPDWQKSDPMKFSLSAKGDWELEKTLRWDMLHWTIAVSCYRDNSGTGDGIVPPTPESFQISLLGDRAPYRLYFEYGDMDAPETITLEKHYGSFQNSAQ